jgi:hypothetical protein
LMPRAAIKRPLFVIARRPSGRRGNIAFRDYPI